MRRNARCFFDEEVAQDTVTCLPTATGHVISLLLQHSKQPESAKPSMSRLRLFAWDEDIECKELPVRPFQSFSGDYEKNFYGRLCRCDALRMPECIALDHCFCFNRFTVTAKTETELFVVLSVSNPAPEFYFRVVCCAGEPFAWNREISKEQIVYEKSSTALLICPRVCLAPGNYLLEGCFGDKKEDDTKCAHEMLRIIR